MVVWDVAKRVARAEGGPKNWNVGVLRPGAVSAVESSRLKNPTSRPFPRDFPEASQRRW